MAFYLRKSYGFGPLRLNLSKSGLGVSGGVTGARVGIGPKGTYVHGGRHGFYYRKYGLGKSKGKAGSARTGSVGDQELFIDTGLTYNKGVSINKKGSTEPLDIPEKTEWVKRLFSLGVIFLVMYFFSKSGLMLIFSGLTFAGSALLYFWFNKKKTELRRSMGELAKMLEEEKPYRELLDFYRSKRFWGELKKVFNYNFYLAVNEFSYNNPEYITTSELRALDGEIALAREVQKEIKIGTFATFLDTVLQDHLISDEEYKALVKLKKGLGLHSNEIKSEITIIETVKRMGEALNEELEVLKLEIPHRPGEKMYYGTEGRMLKSKIMNRYQRNKVVYKERGYDIEFEGRVYVSNKRVFVIGDGTRSYTMNQIVDVTLSIEDNTVQLVIDGRQTPVVFTVPEIGTLAGKINAVIHDQKSQ